MRWGGSLRPWTLPFLAFGRRELLSSASSTTKWRSPHDTPREGFNELLQPKPSEQCLGVPLKASSDDFLLV